MRLLYAYFARSADVLRDGTVAVLGAGFDALKLPSFPAHVTLLSLVVRIRVDREECGKEHVFRLHRVVGPSGNPVGMPTPEPDKFTSELEAAAGFGSFTSIITIANLVFEGQGNYRFVLTVDDAEVGAADLIVFQG